MTRFVRHLGLIAPKLTLALLGAMCSLELALAQAPPELNTSDLTPQQCYRRDSQCTQFCGQVTGPFRYECFDICDRMLNRCLDTGDWSDSRAVDPGPGEPSGGVGPRTPAGAHAILRMMVVLADTDGDGALSLQEIQEAHTKVFKQLDANGDGKATREEIEDFFSFMPAKNRR
jgi:hypothetical protein